MASASPEDDDWWARDDAAAVLARIPPAARIRVKDLVYELRSRQGALERLRADVASLRAAEASSEAQLRADAARAKAQVQERCSETAAGIAARNRRALQQDFDMRTAAWYLQQQGVVTDAALYDCLDGAAHVLFGASLERVGAEVAPNTSQPWKNAREHGLVRGGDEVWHAELLRREEKMRQQQQQQQQQHT